MYGSFILVFIPFILSKNCTIRFLNAQKNLLPEIKQYNRWNTNAIKLLSLLISVVSSTSQIVKYSRYESLSNFLKGIT